MASPEAAAPGGLRVEHLRAPLGLGERRPRLSWRLPSGVTGQHAYRVRLGSGADSGWVTSDRSVLVAWPFAPLASAERVAWQVRVRTDQGESAWSPPAEFETGLLGAADWTASWIRAAETAETAETADPAAPHRPAHELRGVITLAKPDGTIANISPAARAEGIDSPLKILNGSAGWGDAIVIVPWEIYRAYGDAAILDELWPAMVRWLHRTEQAAATGRRHDGRGPAARRQAGNRRTRPALLHGTLGRRLAGQRPCALPRRRPTIGE